MPIHRAIVRRLRDADAASGATVLRGIWGFHGDHKPHGDKLIQLARQVPVTTIVVDTPGAHRRQLRHRRRAHRRHGLVTSEMVPALVSIDGGERMGGTELAQHLY